MVTNLRWLFLALCCLMIACKPEPKIDRITLIIGSWYGFYPLYYASENGIDTKHALDLKILEPTDINDYRRSYLRDQVDIGASSMLEFTNANKFLNLPITPILVTNYSNGGDVIVSLKTITSKEQLKGKRIAVPDKGIGEYVTKLVFSNNEGDHKTQFKQVKIQETECGEAFAQNNIDACVTYPPISTYLLKNDALHVVYSSKEDPQRIFDILWAKPHVSESARKKIADTWFETIALIDQDPMRYYAFVANIANVSVESVKNDMLGIQLINRDKNEALKQSWRQMSEDIVRVCTMIGNDNCQRYNSIFEGQR